MQLNLFSEQRPKQPAKDFTWCDPHQRNCQPTFRCWYHRYLTVEAPCEEAQAGERTARSNAAQERPTD